MKTTKKRDLRVNLPADVREYLDKLKDNSKLNLGTNVKVLRYIIKENEDLENQVKKLNNDLLLKKLGL